MELYEKAEATAANPVTRIRVVMSDSIRVKPRFKHASRSGVGNRDTIESAISAVGSGRIVAE